MNISFLNPSFLWALPAALAPLIVHLFFRRKPKSVEFSDLRFVKLAAERVQTRIKLRRYLLLLIRTLIILILVLAFAKPYFNSRLNAKGAGKEDQLSAVILLDVSYSTGYYEGARKRTDIYKERARRIINLLPPKSRAGVIAYSDKVEAATPALSGDKNYLMNMVDSAKLSNRPTDISCALTAAKTLLDANSSQNRAIIILSDMAGHGFKARTSAIDDKLRVIYFEPSGGENVWIESAEPEYNQNSKQFQINTSVKSAKSSVDSIAASYYGGGRKIGADFLRKSESGIYAGMFTSGDIETQEFSGKVIIAPDKLIVDNSYYFVKKRPADYKIWIIDGDPKFGGASAESFYLKNAFPQAQVVGESGIDSINFTVPGVAVLMNVRNDNPKIAEFIKSGGGALVFLGSHTSESFAPEYLPAVIGSAFIGPETVKWAAAGHKLQELAETGSFEWGKISVGQGFVLMPKENTTVLATLSSGRVFLVEGSYGGSRVALCASTAGREWNNMPARPLYAPFMAALLRYLSGADFKEEKTSYLVGETYRGKAAEGSVIITPGGERIRPVYNGTELYFNNTEEPGIYKVMKGEKEVSVFAVNLNAGSGEGDLTPVTSGALKACFKNCAILEVPQKNWEKYFVSLIAGKDVSREAFALLLLLILLEIMLANPRLRE